jgi:putative nucleotidyltransferase with HDIG domain
MEAAQNYKSPAGHMVPELGWVWWLSVTIAAFFGLLITLGAPYIFDDGLKAGEVADRDLLANRNVIIVDQAATREAQERVGKTVLPVFKRDHSRDKVILKELDRDLDLVPILQKEAGLPLPVAFGLSPRDQAFVLDAPAQIWTEMAKDIEAPGAPDVSNDETGAVKPYVQLQIEARLRKALNSGRGESDPIAAIDSARQAFRKVTKQPQDYLSHEVLYLAVAVPRDEWNDVREGIEEATGRLIHVGALLPGASKEEWEQSVLEFLPDDWDERVRLSSARVIVSNLEPTVSVDWQATSIRAEEAKKAVKPVLRELHEGDVLVPKGQLITEQDLKVLNNMGITNPHALPMLLSLCFSLLAAFALVGVFLYSYEQKHLYSPASIGLISTVSVVTCGIAAFIGQQYPEFVPLPAAVLVLTIFISPRVAVIMLLLLLIFLSIEGLISVHNLLALALASTVAVGAKIKQRKDLMSRGFIIGAAQAAGFLAAIIIGQENMPIGELGRGLALQFLGGLSSCIVAIGSMPFLENIFGMVTQFRLAELTDPTQPLIRQLEENAPGTYQHSLAVANLAEAGARAINGDVNLARAGSLYHDIGKMVRPRYFIENQLGDRNPHDAMTPEESRDRVLAHVTDGVALAEKYALPRVVQDFIPQHQGTTLMAYFYHKACVRDGAENVDQAFYRYPGPKPQSREAAIVMLADVSEAVTHSLKDPTMDEVESSMATVFKARWDDGQFTESGLTPDELERVKKAFVRVWRTLHHDRLKYPSTTTGRMAVPPENPPRIGPAP